MLEIKYRYGVVLDLDPVYTVTTNVADGVLNERSELAEVEHDVPCRTEGSLSVSARILLLI